MPIKTGTLITFYINPYCIFICYLQEIPTIYMEYLRKLLIVMDSRTNYSNYRDMLKNTVAPAVPYLGLSYVIRQKLAYYFVSFRRVFKRFNFYK